MNDGSFLYIFRATRIVIDTLSDAELNSLYMCLQLGTYLTGRNFSDKIQPLLTQQMADGSATMHTEVVRAISTLWKERFA